MTLPRDVLFGETNNRCSWFHAHITVKTDRYLNIYESERADAGLYKKFCKNAKFYLHSLSYCGKVYVGLL